MLQDVILQQLLFSQWAYSTQKLNKARNNQPEESQGEPLNNTHTKHTVHVMYQLCSIFKTLQADKLLRSVILSRGTRLHINSEDMEDMSEYQTAVATGFMFDNLIGCIPGFQAGARDGSNFREYLTHHK